jgi:hypothetical protein
MIGHKLLNKTKSTTVDKPKKIFPTNQALSYRSDAATRCRAATSPTCMVAYASRSHNPQSAEAGKDSFYRGRLYCGRM